MVENRHQITVIKLKNSHEKLVMIVEFRRKAARAVDNSRLFESLILVNR